MTHTLYLFAEFVYDMLLCTVSKNRRLIYCLALHDVLSTMQIYGAFKLATLKLTLTPLYVKQTYILLDFLKDFPRKETALIEEK